MIRHYLRGSHEVLLETLREHRYNNKKKWLNFVKRSAIKMRRKKSGCQIEVQDPERGPHREWER